MPEDKPALDAGQISDLLDIVERTFNRPKLKVIHDAAMAQLEEIAAEMTPKVEDPAVPLEPKEAA